MTRDEQITAHLRFLAATGCQTRMEYTAVAALENEAAARALLAIAVRKLDEFCPGEDVLIGKIWALLDGVG